MNNLIEAIKEGDIDKVATILENNAALINQYDDTGATPLHYAALFGHQPIVRLLIEKGALINSTDKEFGATPTGWAIEYLRELGGYLTIELDDLSYAIQEGDVRWATRFLQRFPTLRTANDKNGKPFLQLAQATGNQEIINLFP